ncbi:MAG: choice-of-anchor D domain-containing protein [Ignavibacteria bacterium]|nr:choice-of-anchor D domain-containing protein [Ignavibacteria bacterium]
MKQFCTFLMCLCVAVMVAPSSVRAQDIVVSEYSDFNGVPDGEWTEILVVKDNLTIVGYTFRDNVTNFDTWNGCVRFKDVPMWRNLRAGTVIVIQHRLQQNPLYIVNKSYVDGHIEVEANDWSVFDSLGIIGQEWKLLGVLSISQARDIIQITNEAGTHVHALSHGSNTGNDYNNLPQPKLQHPSSISAGNLVRVYPGATIADYSGSGTKTLASAPIPSNASKGFPNFGATANDILNSQFWRTTRQPLWTSPTLTTTVVGGNTVKLSWNAMTDPNQSDNIQGYLVLFALETQSDTNKVPQDGKNYAPGETIGDWRVLANLSSTVTTYDDAIPTMTCGLNYKYRVFAFRYTKDDLEDAVISTDTKYGRGRAYNETNYASAIAVKIAPVKPDITASGPLSFCIGKNVTLSTATTAGLTFQWSRNGADIPGATTNSIIASTAGQYRVRATNAVNCTTESDPKEVIILAKPTAVITAGSLFLCSGDTVSLTSDPATSYEWIKDGVTITAQTGQIHRASSAGAYRVIVKNADGCADTSQITTLTQRVVTYSFNKPDIDFGKLNDCQSSATQPIILTNTSNESITIDNISATPGFGYVSPSLPITLQKGQSQTLTFQFTPQISGTSSGTATFVASPCGVKQTIQLKGSKDVTKVVLGVTSFDFGRILSCENTGRDTNIWVYNRGNSDLEITGRRLGNSTGYNLLNNINLPKIVKPGDSAMIGITFNPPSAGSYFSILIVDYKFGVCTDSLIANLQGIVVTPSFSADITDITFPLIQACDPPRDTVITLTNPGSDTLKITTQPTDPNVVFIGLPVTIPPKQTAQLRVRFQPQSFGAVTALSIPIIADKCNATVILKISGSKQGTTFKFSEERNLNFGDMSYCSAIQFKQTVRLTITGATGAEKVSKIIANPPFSFTSLKEGDAVKDGDIIELQFAPSAIGDFRDTVFVVFEPCGEQRAIPVRGRRLSTLFTANTNPTDFATIDSGLTSDKVVTIRNTGTSDLQIKRIDGVTPPFSVVSMTATLPAILKTNETMDVTIRYAPLTASRDSVLMKFIIDRPCDTNSVITLLGLGKVNAPPPPADTIPTTATIQIGSGTANVGERVTLPLTISSTDIQLSRIFRFAIDVTYNPRLLMPRAVRVGAAQTGFTASYADVTPGQTTITVSHPDGVAATQFIQPGAFAELECEALLGDELTTPLTVSNPNISRSVLPTANKKPTIILGAAGTFTLSGDCALDSRRVRIGGNVTLLQRASTSEVLELEFETVSEDHTSLAVYSSLGMLTREIYNGPLLSGNHSVQLELNGISGGAYYVVMRTGTSVSVLPVIIEK